MNTPPVKHYVNIAGALLALLGLTLGAAYLDLGVFNTPVAMAISAAKATLILLFFMNLRRSTTLVRLYACAGFFWLAILLALAFSDFASR